MKACFLKLLSLLLSLAALCALVPSALADDGGALDFSIHHADSSATVAVLPTQTDTAPTPADPVGSSPVGHASPAALSFDPPKASASVASVPKGETLSPVATDGDTLFAGGSDSLVARTVGHAEGTRTADGHKTRAYYGHSDPGNGVWNLGSFSYQHAASSPEDADEKQLARLKRQREALRQKAAAARLQWSREEELNAIDLANQAPLAALDTPGYVEWLKQAHDRGLTGEDAILWARTQSYWNPRKERWEAPGLGNTEGSISHDQNRRLTAIARALDTYEQQAQARPKAAEPPVKVATRPPQEHPPQESAADRIIFQDLSPPRPHDVAVAP